jgi:hypothetical protein
MTDLLTDPEQLFPPKAGGMVDTARKRAQAEADQLGALHAMPEPPGVNHPIPVTQRGADLARSRTFSVSTGGANPIVELLGQDLNRRSAVVLTLDEPVVISFSAQAADDPRNAVNAAGLSANGFVLPVNVPVTLPTRSVIYCTALSATPTRVSVAAFSFAEA